jgi:hypothetical protein
MIKIGDQYLIGTEEFPGHKYLIRSIGKTIVVVSIAITTVEYDYIDCDVQCNPFAKTDIELYKDIESGLLTLVNDFKPKSFNRLRFLNK